MAALTCPTAHRPAAFRLGRDDLGRYDGRTIAVQQIETGERLTIPVHHASRGELERWRAEPLAGANVLPHPGAPILTTTEGRRWSGTYLSMGFADAVRKAGLPAGLNVHGLRKRAAVSLAEAGCSVYEILAITGHRSVKSLVPYVEKARQGVLAEAAMRRLEASPTSQERGLHGEPEYGKRVARNSVISND
jgi:integrase